MKHALRRLDALQHIYSNTQLYKNQHLQPQRTTKAIDRRTGERRLQVSSGQVIRYPDMVRPPGGVMMRGE